MAINCVCVCVFKAIWNGEIIHLVTDEEEEEPEMQIGRPTDVKHVAHIGCDGQSINNSPTWVGVLTIISSNHFYYFYYLFSFKKFYFNTRVYLLF